MGDQRAISAFTRRAKLAGVLSGLAGIDPPRSASRFLTEGSSSALSSAAASLAMISLGVHLGAKMPAQIMLPASKVYPSGGAVATRARDFEPVGLTERSA